MAQVYLQGKACQLGGELPETGRQAPDFLLVSTRLKDMNLASFADSKKLIYTVPSLDTMVCAKTTKTLNELAVGWDNMNVLVVSADLPFAQQRFIKQHKLKNITALSMMRNKQFAIDYGVLLMDGSLA
ncbi:MAG TPA: thiol peroxidase, partial [Gammaproteobacteria bacterium]|nr:thiol peroxidase [Gammaproteobacteria bacterium]